MYLIKYTKILLQQVSTLILSSTGRALRQTGLTLDREGSLRTGDIAFMQPHNRHRNILNLYQQHPQISPSAYVAPNATVIGDVFVGQNSYFGFGSVAHGEHHAVRVGYESKVGENTVLEPNVLGNDQAYPLSVNIGNNVTIENNCHLVSCIVDDDSHIGHGSVIMQGSQLQRGCVIAPNSYVPAGSRIPAYTTWAGVPVRFVKNNEKPGTDKVGESVREEIRIEGV